MFVVVVVVVKQKVKVWILVVKAPATGTKYGYVLRRINPKRKCKKGKGSVIFLVAK